MHFDGTGSLEIEGNEDQCFQLKILNCIRTNTHINITFRTDYDNGMTADGVLQLEAHKKPQHTEGKWQEYDDTGKALPDEDLVHADVDGRLNVPQKDWIKFEGTWIDRDGDMRGKVYQFEIESNVMHANP